MDEEIFAIVIDSNGKQELTKEEFNNYTPPVVETPDLCNRINALLQNNTNANYVLAIWDKYAQYINSPQIQTEDEFFNSI